MFFKILLEISTKHKLQYRCQIDYVDDRTYKIKLVNYLFNCDYKKYNLIGENKFKATEVYPNLLCTFYTETLNQRIKGLTFKLHQ